MSGKSLVNNVERGEESTKLELLSSRVNAYVQRKRADDGFYASHQQELQHQLDEKTKELEALRAEMRKQIGALRKSNEKLIEENSTLKNNDCSQHDELIILRQQVKELQCQKDDRDQLRKQLSEATTEIEGAKETLEKTNILLQRTQTELTREQKELRRLRFRVADLEKTCSLLTSGKDDVEKRMQMDIDKLVSKNALDKEAALELARRQSDERFAKFENKLKDQYEGVNSKFRHRCDKLQKDNEKVRLEIKQRDKEYNDSLKRNQLLKIELDKLIESHRAEIFQLKEKLTQEGLLRNNAETKYADRESECNELQDCNIKLTSQIEAMLQTFEMEETRLKQSPPLLAASSSKRKAGQDSDAAKRVKYSPPPEVIVERISSPSCVMIRNVGTSNAIMDGWILESKHTKERFQFPEGFVLPLAESVEVWSGKKHKDKGPGTLFWTRRHAWSGKDEVAMLKNEDDRVQSELALPIERGGSEIILQRLDLQNSCVIVQNVSKDITSLEGWSLLSESGGNAFTFSTNFTLLGGASVTVWSGKSNKDVHNNHVNLFWDDGDAFDKRGGGVTLLNPEGKRVSTVAQEGFALDMGEDYFNGDVEGSTEGRDGSCSVM